MSNGNRRRASFIDSARRAFSRRRGVSGLMLTAAFTLSAGAAPHDASAAAPDYRQAYQYSLRCYAANGVLASESARNNQAADEQKYNANGQRAYDSAQKLGRLLGYPDAQVQADFHRMNTDEATRIFQDGDYRRQTYAICRALGFM